MHKRCLSKKDCDIQGLRTLKWTSKNQWFKELATLLALRCTSWCEWKLLDKGRNLLCYLARVAPMTKTKIKRSEERVTFIKGIHIPRRLHIANWSLDSDSNWLWVHDCCPWDIFTGLSVSISHAILKTNYDELLSRVDHDNNMQLSIII